MNLPIMLPVAPMLAKAVDEIPVGEFAYEPKWDGFRSIIIIDGGDVQIGSRSGLPMTRYFPDVVAAAKSNLPACCVVDGEIVAPGPSGTRLDFEALQQRIHPAESRVRMLAEKTPAHFVAFDILALGMRDLMRDPFRERRQVLADMLAGARSPIHLTRSTTDPKVAGRWFAEFEGAGIDGIVAKRLDGTYEPNKRVMFKIKHVRTADCVVAGYRIYKGDAEAIGSLLLGLYDTDGALAHVGVVGAFALAQRRALLKEFQPLVTSFEGHPWGEETSGATARTPRSASYSRWSAGKDLSFVPLRPERVVEVRYDHMEGKRFRHTAQFVRWRHDRDPRSCTFEQLESPAGIDLADVL